MANPANSRPTSYNRDEGGEKPMNDRIMRITELETMLGISRSSIYAWIKGGTFPKQIKLSIRLVGWKASEIQAWIDAKG